MQKKLETYLLKHFDKLLHFVAGLLLSLAVFISWYFIILPVAVAIGKEAYDKYIRKSKFDWKDIAATLLGCIPVLIIYLINYLT